ncbi:hypothetical protein TNCT_527771 [Trichonephila clavata]|uniref:Uncharacterized protein n=1 Tax=Trichonephila clavata TaxID=2740835 RepID=A0A8X6HGQ3_TRICU|nr:hypothetical protein TNCT_527771 [Trichonephila clavata]
MQGDLTAKRPAGICGGVAYCSFCQGTTFTELWKDSETHRPYVLMHAGWSYRNPFVWHMRWGSVMFVPPRHDIYWPVEEFITELCIHPPYVLMHAGWPTANSTPGIFGGEA